MPASEISSPQNPLIQRIRTLQGQARDRREAGQFVIEGTRLLEEVLAAGIIPETVIHTDPLNDRAEAILAGFRARGVRPISVDQRAMQAASDTKSPQGLLAILPIQPRQLPPTPTFILILDEVRDPGNLGAILRIAAAAAVDAILLSPGCADPYAPKVVRAGMGAHFRVPIHPLGWEEIRGATTPLKVFLADSGGALSIGEADFSLPLALIIGGEARGAGDLSGGLDPVGVRIPMPGGTESLNAAVAAGILIFEVVRQRQ